MARTAASRRWFAAERPSRVVGAVALAVMAASRLAGSAAAADPGVTDNLARFSHAAKTASQETVVPAQRKPVAAPGKATSQGDPGARSAAAPAKAAAVSASTSVRMEMVDFADLPGWSDDDHLAGLKAFGRSCERVAAAARAGNRSGSTPTPPALLAACADAAALLAAGASRVTARAFFEQHFRPHRVAHSAASGLLTGYYEPVIDGAREPGADFTAPIYRRPPDLINLVSEAERGAKAEQLTHARKTDAGWEPYATRQEIDGGALSGKGLELLYLKDPVDVFFMQVQGSGRIALADGGSVRVTYDGKNGHPYSSIGKYLIDSGLLPADKMSLQALKSWLRKNPRHMRDVLWQNKSYVFFRELAGAEADGPLGVLSIPLTPGRSLAVDTAYHAIGLPVYVSSDTLTHATRSDKGFHRLMVAQDVGSAIRGPERGDIYFGSGDKAGALAGITKHPGNFFVLLPRASERGTVIEADAAAAAAAPAGGPAQRQASQ